VATRVLLLRRIEGACEAGNGTQEQPEPPSRRLAGLRATRGRPAPLRLMFHIARKG